MADDPRAPDARTAEASRRTRHGCEVVLSYEEQILNALGRLKRPRGEDFLARMKREFDAIREVLAPLYAEVKAARRLASPAPLLAGVTSDDTWGCADCGLIANRPVACDCDTAKPRTEGTDGALAEAVAELRAWSRHDRTVFAGVPASVPTAIRLVLSALAQAQADLAAARRTS